MRRRVKVSPGQLPLFVEKPFDSRALLAGTYEFKTCQYPDGTYYGTANSNQCRKGTEVSAKQIQEDISKKVSTRDYSLQKIKNPTSKKELAKDIDRIEALGKETGDSITSQTIDKANADINKRRDEILARMDNNEISVKEMDDFILKRNFVGDPKTAETIVIGIEQTIPTAAVNEGGRGYDKFIATQMATQQLQAENPSQSKQYDLALGLKEEKGSQFTGNHARLITALTGDTVSSIELTTGLKNTAGMELRSVPANRENGFELGQRPWVKNNPALDAKVGSDRAGDRKNYNANYADPMAKRLTDTVAASVRDNPNLKTVTLGLGKNEPARDQILRDIEKIPGSKSRSFSYKDEKGETVQGTIIDVGGKGKTHVYDFGQSVNARGFNSGSVAKTFIEQRQRLDAGRVRSYDRASTAIKNQEYVANAKTGKSQTTPAAMSGVSSRNLKKALNEPNMGKVKKTKIQAELDRRNGGGGSTRKASAPKATKVAKSSGPTKTEKLEKELQKQQKAIQNARKKRDKYKDKPNSASYKKAAAEVNSLLTEERKMKKEGGLL